MTVNAVHLFNAMPFAADLEGSIAFNLVKP
jgi:hypothetical protein